MTMLRCNGCESKNRQFFGLQFSSKLLFLALALCFFITAKAGAQNYLSASGTPTFVSPEAVEQGFADAANGNLHLEWAFGSYPQRASSQPFAVKYVYDSNMVWGAGCSGSGCSWAPSSANNYGWRLATNGGTLTGLNCSSQCTEWAFTDPLGTTRYFPVSTGTCPIPNSYATDSSGYMLNLCQTGIYAPDGTLVYSATYEQQASPGAEDSNGNYITWGAGGLGNSKDTVGRYVPPFGTSNCNGNSNQTCFTVPNSQDGNSTYTITTTTIPVNTQFGQSGVTEYSGSLTVVQSIGLPDGTSYTFQFDCDSSTGNPACSTPHGQSAYYGLLTSMTLPTGGTVTYSYTTFNDSYSNKTRWLYSRSTVGGTWTYAPQVISTCTSTQVGCQQKVTVSAPNGDYKVYTFTLNNGAWPVTIQSFDSSSALLETVNNTYDFSQSCPFSGCYGAAYIRLTNSQTTVSAPSGNLAKQTAYSYDSPQTGNITATKEWGYYPSSFPSTPDRATYTTYLSTGNNDINRPLSVTVCNNSGSDSDCPGGGSKVQQTKYTYDVYSGCPSGLASITGIMNHDDANFGSGYTTRGNPTLIQQWVSGSSFVNTSLCYDTTGQVTQATDPKGNITYYGYADRYYSDNGTNSLSSFTPSQPTNAYVTSIQQPIIGTSTFGYYYGSGKQAFATDPNAATEYAHFMDPFDRSTENDHALVGWDKTVYTSATQSDSYVGVGDTTPSTGCQSCEHTQLFIDSFGRKSSEKVFNYPGGPVSVDTAYEAKGRVNSVSHPYQSGPVYESYSYDGIDRSVQNTHPDNQSVHAYYGPNVVSSGGLSSQQGSPSTYGYGYPVLYVDEAGKERQEWHDGFGRTIEVDEPVYTPATPATGSVTIGGSEQQTSTSGSQSSIVISVSGDEQSICSRYTGDTCTRYLYDSGTVTMTVDGCTTSTSYGASSTQGTIGNNLAAGFSCSTVTASSDGLGNVTFRSVAYSSSADYPFSASASTNNPGTFGSGSFEVYPASGNMSGGSDPTTIYDSGTVQITVNGEQHSVSYGQGSTASSVASALASAFTGSSNVNASATGSTVYFTTTATGASTNYSLSASSSTSQGGYFSQPSFSTSPSGSNLTGGTNAGTPLQQATFYSYDAGDRLIQVSQGVQTRTFAFDGLGRATSVSTPEAGTETFAYSVSGALCSGDPSDVCQRTDARGAVTTYYYDQLNRLTGKTYSIPGGVAAMPNVCTTQTSQAANTCFNYDQGGAAAYALGRKTQMVDPSGSESFTYDQAGRVTHITKVIGSNTYNIGYQYNAADEITQETYPSGRTVQQSYNAVGQLCEIAGQTSGCGTSAAPWGTAFGYNASGQLTGLNYGNGVTAAYGYSSARAQLSSLSYTKSGTTLFSLNYWYQQNSPNCPNGNSVGNDGRIQCITDNVDSGRTVNFGYDVVNRLTSAVTNGSGNFPQWGLSWTYDRYGNRLNQSVTAGSGFNSSLTFSNPGGAQTNRPDGWCFDASGNVLVEGSCGGNQFLYDGENRMVGDPAAGSVYLYDGNGMRVEKCFPNCSSPPSSTVYVYADSQDIAEYDNGAAPSAPSREFILSDSVSGTGLLASIVGGTTTYFHPDHLDWRVNTNTAGQIAGQQGTYPYGQSWYSSNGNEFVFTTYQRDSESGLDYALARYYDSSVSRFCTVDPLGGQTDDPQSLNRYAYVRDDPVNLTDPTGQGFWTWFADALSFVGDLFTGGAFLPETIQLTTGLSMAADIGAFADVVHVGMQTMPQGQSYQKQPQQVSKRITCDPWSVHLTVVGGKQAPGKGAFSGKAPRVGDVAIDPTQFGYPDYYDLASKINPRNPGENTAQYPDSKGAFSKLQQEQRDIKNAHITITMTSNTPKGLPGGSGPHSAVDAIHPPQEDTIDVYRTRTLSQARRLGRIPATAAVTLTPTGKVECPQ
jgi:RHS repeat-associated protein